MKKIYLLIAVLLAFTACENKELKEEQTSSLKTVFAIKAKPADEDQKRVFAATATSNKNAKLSFKVNGNITHFKLKIGEFIHQNQLIAKLDSDPYDIKLSEAQYALNQAKAQLHNHKNSYERVKKLYINQNASASDIDNAKAAYQASLANVENRNKQLEYAKLQLSYTKLYAPLSGYLSHKFVEENENVKAGTPIVLLSDKKVDEVSVQIPQNTINKIKDNQKVEVLFNLLEDKKFDAKVHEISKYSSIESKTYQVKVKLDEPVDAIKAGMSAEVYFDFESKQNNVFYVPSRSVLKDNKGHFVYLLKKQSANYSVKKQYVKVGKLTSYGYEILTHLTQDSLVLKAGMSEVYEDLEVEITNKKELGL